MQFSIYGQNSLWRFFKRFQIMVVLEENSIDYLFSNLLIKKILKD
jgi:hypothetical protein